MKKILSCVLVFLIVALSGCTANISIMGNDQIKETRNKKVEVKGGYIDLSVDEFETNFNSRLDVGYKKAKLKEMVTNNDSSFYRCELQDDIDLSLLANSDASMISIITLSFDALAENDAANTAGYYYAKLIYAVAPDITSDEIIEIADEIDIESPLSDGYHVTKRNGILYSLSVAEDGTLSLMACAYK